MKHFFLQLGMALGLLATLVPDPASARLQASAEDPPPCVGTRAKVEVPARSVIGQPVTLTLRLEGPGVLVPPVRWEPSHVLVDEVRTGGATLTYSYPRKGSHLALVRAQVLLPDTQALCSVWDRVAVRVVDEVPPPVTVTVTCDPTVTYPATPVTCVATAEGMSIASPQWVWSCGSAVAEAATCAWPEAGQHTVTARVHGIGSSQGLGLVSGVGSTSVQVVPLDGSPAPPAPPEPPAFPNPTEPTAPQPPVPEPPEDGTATYSMEDIRHFVQHLRNLLDAVDMALAETSDDGVRVQRGVP